MKTTKPPVLSTLIRTHSSRYALDDDRRELREQYPGASIRTFHRDVRVDGLVFPVHVIVVRERRGTR